MAMEGIQFAKAKAPRPNEEDRSGKSSLLETVQISRSADLAEEAREEMAFKARSAERAREKQALLRLIAEREREQFTINEKQHKRDKKQKHRDRHKSKKRSKEREIDDSPRRSSSKCKKAEQMGRAKQGIDLKQANQHGFPPCAKIITEEPIGSSAGHDLLPRDRNKLAALALRAKMRGNLKEHIKLQKVLEQLTNVENTKSDPVPSLASPTKNGLGAQLLPQSKNLFTPVMLNQKSAPSENFFALCGDTNKKRKSKVLSRQEMENRDRDMSIREMLASELTEENMDETYAHNVLRGGNPKGAKIRMFDDEVSEEAMLYRSKRSRASASKQADIDHQRAVNAHRAACKEEEQDPLSFDSPKFDRSLVLCIANHTCLVLPKTPLGPGHVRIIPLQALPALSMVAPEVRSEVLEFQKSLESMHAVENESLVYLETVLKPGGGRRGYIDCIPVDEPIAETVPLIFKKELMDIGDEWDSNHHYRAMDIGGKSLSQCVPPHAPYCLVAWGGEGFPRGGFAHLIQDARGFKRSTLEDIMRGCLGSEIAGFRRANTSDAATQRTRKEAFQAAWAPFDWRSKP